MAEVAVTAYEADLQTDITAGQAAPFNIAVSTTTTGPGVLLPSIGWFYGAVEREVFRLTRETAPASQLRVLERAVESSAVAHDADTAGVTVRSVPSTDAAPDGRLASQAALDALAAQVPAGGDSHVSLAADRPVTTTTTLVNTTGLSFAVTAGSLYRFMAMVVFRSGTSTIGLKLGATVPAFTVYGASVLVPIANDGTAAAFHGWLTSSGDSVVGTAVAAINTDFVATVHGMLVPSASGTVQVQHASDATGSAGITVRRGSVLTYTTI
jgi:hypothetical protein